MAELTTVARPYAEAVFRAAVDAKDVAGFGVKLKALGMVAENAQMASLLGNPNVSVSEKSSLMSTVAGGNVPTALANAVSMLVTNGKAKLLPFVSEHFERLQRDHEGVVKAVITSAFPLSDTDKAGLVDALARKYGKRVEAVVTIDESLIGGARVQVGDDVVHASVRDTLNKMAQALVQ
jgi:F-type H+-transporting ATPase subunit delta